MNTEFDIDNDNDEPQASNRIRAFKGHRRLGAMGHEVVYLKADKMIKIKTPECTFTVQVESEEVAILPRNDREIMLEEIHDVLVKEQVRCNEVVAAELRISRQSRAESERLKEELDRRMKALSDYESAVIRLQAVIAFYHEDLVKRLKSRSPSISRNARKLRAKAPRGWGRP